MLDLRCRRFVALPPLVSSQRCAGYKFGRLIEPAAKIAVSAERSGFAEEDQEGGLRGVFGHVKIPSDAQAYVVDHAAVDSVTSTAPWVSGSAPPTLPF